MSIIKSLSMRELQRRAAAVEEFPVIITKNNKPFCVLIGIEEYNRLLETADYDPISMHQDMQVLNDYFIRDKRMSVEQVLEAIREEMAGADHSVADYSVKFKDAVKKFDRAKDFVDQMKGLGFNIKSME